MGLALCSASEFHKALHAEDNKKLLTALDKKKHKMNVGIIYRFARWRSDK